MLKLTKSTICLIAATLFSAAAHAQDPAYFATLQAESGFSSWPGQSGPVQGFNFQVGQYPALTGFSATSDTLSLDYLTYGVMRIITLSNGAGALTLTMGVGGGSVTNGHTLFLTSYPTNSDLDYFSVFVRGDLLATNPVTVGDLNYIPANADATNTQGYLSFMRNNVFVTIEDSLNLPSGVNVLLLAAELDAAIQTQGTGPFTYAPPVITTFLPATTTLSASAGGSTTATVSITDPTLNSGPITRQFQTGGNLTVVDSGGPTVTIAATSTTGSLPLTLVAINAYLQISTATVTFNVTP